MKQRLCELVRKKFPSYKLEGYSVLVGDGKNNPLEGKKIPLAQRIVQNSQNSRKPEHFFGHILGGLGIITGTEDNHYLTPLNLEIYSQLQGSINKWRGRLLKSQTVEMIKEAARVASWFNKSLLVLDRYYLSVPVLKELDRINQVNPERLSLVTRAKKNIIAFKKPGKSTGKRGRPRKRGKRIQLFDLFEKEQDKFTQTTLKIYGKETPLKFYSVDLLWGIGYYQMVRFVLVEKPDHSKSILVSNNLNLQAETIIKAYSLRFGIENTFKDLSSNLGAFNYHFWSQDLPAQNKNKANSENDPTAEIDDLKAQENIVNTVKAIELFLFMALVTLVVLQFISLGTSVKGRKNQLVYQRTYSESRYSIRVTKILLSRKIQVCLAQNVDQTCIKSILEKRRLGQSLRSKQSSA